MALGRVRRPRPGRARPRALSDPVAAAYREAIAEWGALGASGRDASRVVPRFLAAYRKLVKTPEGREAIDRLRGDDDPWVRMVAASHSVPWAEAEAREVLVALRDDVGGGPGGDALLTLMQLDNGTYRSPSQRRFAPWANFRR